IAAIDGDIGRVRDAYFDDRQWRIRYLVADSWHWLPGRRVLISPLSVRQTDHQHRILQAALTKAQVANGPQFDTEKPVSRQHELDRYRYYLPYYWVSAGAGGTPAGLGLETDWGAQQHRDPHLRSVRAITHHYVHAVDTDIGHVADFLYDDTSWTIGYLVVVIRTLRAGRRVLVPVESVTWVSWDAGTVDVRLRSETIRLAPEYDEDWPLDAE